ncbi:MAG: hypothetical protein EOO20_06320 [Chryseobacterium sp.]|nr:MAG: hypothetical protein EOO20_06320 [Chryseobacterium sp.]
MDIPNIITLIGFMGIGALIKSFVDAALHKRQNRSQKQHEFKETRYKAVIMLMLALLDFEKNLPNLKQHGRNYSSPEQLLDEIKDERNNMLLYASDSVINAIKQFINEPNELTFYEAAIKMRQDLYGLGTKLRPKNLLITENR